jgi:hypothetical protein
MRALMASLPPEPAPGASEVEFEAHLRAWRARAVGALKGLISVVPGEYTGKQGQTQARRRFERQHRRNSEFLNKRGFSGLLLGAGEGEDEEELDPRAMLRKAGQMAMKASVKSASTSDRGGQGTLRGRGQAKAGPSLAAASTPAPRARSGSPSTSPRTAPVHAGCSGVGSGAGDEGSDEDATVASTQVPWCCLSDEGTRPSGNVHLSSGSDGVSPCAAASLAEAPPAQLALSLDMTLPATAAQHLVLSVALLPTAAAVPCPASLSADAGARARRTAKETRTASTAAAALSLLFASKLPSDFAPLPSLAGAAAVATENPCLGASWASLLETQTHDVVPLPLSIVAVHTLPSARPAHARSPAAGQPMSPSAQSQSPSQLSSLCPPVFLHPRDPLALEAAPTRSSTLALALGHHAPAQALQTVHRRPDASASAAASPPPKNALHTSPSADVDARAATVLYDARQRLAYVPYVHAATGPGSGSVDREDDNQPPACLLPLGAPLLVQHSGLAAHTLRRFKVSVPLPCIASREVHDACIRHVINRSLSAIARRERPNTRDGLVDALADSCGEYPVPLHAMVVVRHKTKNVVLGMQVVRVFVKIDLDDGVNSHKSP